MQKNIKGTELCEYTRLDFLFYFFLVLGIEMLPRKCWRLAGMPAAFSCFKLKKLLLRGLVLPKENYLMKY